MAGDDASSKNIVEVKKNQRRQDAAGVDFESFLPRPLQLPGPPSLTARDAEITAQLEARVDRSSRSSSPARPAWREAGIATPPSSRSPSRSPAKLPLTTRSSSTSRIRQPDSRRRLGAFDEGDEGNEGGAGATRGGGGGGGRGRERERECGRVCGRGRGRGDKMAAAASRAATAATATAAASPSASVGRRRRPRLRPRPRR